MRIRLTSGLLLAAALAIFASSAGALRTALPRSTVDRPDDRTGAQVHVLYVVPSDLAERSLDVDGTIEASVSSFQGWLAGQTGGRALRLDTFQGSPDVSFVRLARTDAAVAANGAYVRDVIERELRGAGFADPQKLYAVYYDGSSTYGCGGGAWPPTLVGTVAAVYMRATYGAGALCYDPARSRSGLQLMDLALLHETLHTMGFVPACAPHHTRAGHTSDSPADLMYAGDEPWVPSVLDVGRDDYFDANVPGCPDLADSPFLQGNERVRLAVAVAERGGTGRVTSDPAAIDCPATCSAELAPGSTIVLTASPAAGSRFDGWTGACTGSGPCTLTMGGPKSVGASFGRGTFSLAVAVAGSGRVTSNPAGIACRPRCRASFAAGDRVALRALPARGWRFHAWSGLCSGRRACTVRMDADRAVRARFRRGPR